MIKESSAWTDLPKRVRGMMRSNIKNDTPFLLSPIKYLAGKISKKAPDKISNAYADYVGVPLQKLDINLGGLAQKGLRKIRKKNTGKFFSENLNLESGKQRGTRTGVQEHNIPSLIAPVGKASKIALPALGAMKLDSMINGEPKMNKQIVKTADLHKAAEMLSTMNSRNKELEKQARATELLYKQAELGQVIFPKTHEEYQEKVAELLVKNLDVVEEAIKMASATEEYITTYGDLSGSTSTASGSARQNFERTIIEN